MNPRPAPKNRQKIPILAKVRLHAGKTVISLTSVITGCSREPVSDSVRTQYGTSIRGPGKTNPPRCTCIYVCIGRDRTEEPPLTKPSPPMTDGTLLAYADALTGTKHDCIGSTIRSNLLLLPPTGANSHLFLVRKLSFLPIILSTKFIVFRIYRTASPHGSSRRPFPANVFLQINLLWLVLRPQLPHGATAHRSC